MNATLHTWHRRCNPPCCCGLPFAPTIMAAFTAATQLCPRRRAAKPPSWRARRAVRPRATPSNTASFADAAAAEEALLSTVASMRGRGAMATAEQEGAVAAALAVLEADGGVPEPAESPLIEGVWKLLYTSKSSFDIRNPLGARVDGSAPGLEAIFRTLFGGAEASGGSSAASSSPIQRTITSNDAFTVLQTVSLRAAEPRVDNVVQFGDRFGTLLLEATASVPTNSPGRRRIDFAFSGGYFETAELPAVGRLRIPYPVPFKLLGDEAKGWLDTLYLSERVRISKGNKGTTFILTRV